MPFRESEVPAHILRYTPHYMETFYMWRGRELLLKMGSDDASQHDWWPQAESVMAWWLEKLSQGHWGWGDDHPIGRENLGWVEMGEALASAIANEADRLESDQIYKKWRPDGVIALAEASGRQRGQ